MKKYLIFVLVLAMLFSISILSSKGIIKLVRNIVLFALGVQVVGTIANFFILMMLITKTEIFIVGEAFTTYRKILPNQNGTSKSPSPTKSINLVPFC